MKHTGLLGTSLQWIFTKIFWLSKTLPCQTMNFQSSHICMQRKMVLFSELGFEDLSLMSPTFLWSKYSQKLVNSYISPPHLKKKKKNNSLDFFSSRKFTRLHSEEKKTIERNIDLDDNIQGKQIMSTLFMHVDSL